MAAEQLISSELFVPIKFNTSVQLKPSELGPNIEEVIYTKLSLNLENMCSKHGFIKKNSIRIIKRSIGHLKQQHFNGNVSYDLQCIAEICNPAQGSIIKCRVKAKNSLGLLAEGFYGDIPILQIIVPKISAGIQSEININNVNVGDEINIEVCGKKFMLYEKYISIIGKAVKDKEQQTVVVDARDADEDKPVAIDDIDVIPEVPVYDEIADDEQYNEDDVTEDADREGADGEEAAPEDEEIEDEDDEEIEEDEDEEDEEEDFDIEEFEGGDFDGGDDYGVDDFE
jgi:hypothetical protein